MDDSSNTCIALFLSILQQKKENLTGSVAALRSSQILSGLIIFVIDNESVNDGTDSFRESC